LHCLTRINHVGVHSYSIALLFTKTFASKAIEGGSSQDLFGQTTYLTIYNIETLIV